MATSAISRRSLRALTNFRSQRERGESSIRVEWGPYCILPQRLTHRSPSLPSSAQLLNLTAANSTESPSTEPRSLQENITSILDELIDGYDNRIRPGIGGLAAVPTSSHLQRASTHLHRTSHCTSNLHLHSASTSTHLPRTSTHLHRASHGTSKQCIYLYTYSQDIYSSTQSISRHIEAVHLPLHIFPGHLLIYTEHLTAHLSSASTSTHIPRTSTHLHRASHGTSKHCIYLYTYSQDIYSSTQRISRHI
ncbi:Gamma-aminobutyric acid receptor subunit alpha-6 [Branchiostoma belcheri]|nr:Gamma-aminobutyric acid receptor subunit alpha-6 [Branchiostoma belcheri]